jgi:hypothetical protein
MTVPSRSTLAALAVLVVLAAIAVLTAQRQEPTENVYASTDYGAGGYRAWAALLASEGVTTTRFVRRPIDLDAQTDTLVSAQAPALQTDPAARTAADVAALAAWVRSGGRLVYVGRDSGVAAAEKSSLRLPLVLPEVGARGRLVGPLAAPVRSVQGLGTSRMLFVEQAGSVLLGDGNGDVVVRYPLGRGEVIAIVDQRPFSNDELARADNARLAYLVARPRSVNGVVAFDDGLHGALIDRPWYRALPIALRVGLGFAALAILLGIVGTALPGPAPMPLRLAREPSSAEFVDALAALYARTHARTAVAGILISDALAQAARRVGLPDDAPTDVLAARMGPVGGGAAIETLAHLAAMELTTDADLLARAKLAHLIRKESSHGADRDRRRPAFTGRIRSHRRR